MLTVTVQDGTVDLWGLVHSVEEKKAAQLAAETTPGVRAVVNNVIVQPTRRLWLVLSRRIWLKWSRLTRCSTSNLIPCRLSWYQPNWPAAEQLRT
jgi:hypothetical protein